MTEVLATNMVGVMATEEGEDVVCLGDGFNQVDEDEKLLCFLGDGESLPIDVEREEYNVIPDGTPDQWYERYCVKDDLTPECKALHKKAVDFYNEKELLKTHVKVKVLEYDSAENVVKSGSVEESGSVSRKKAKWFADMDIKMANRDAISRGGSQSATERKRRDRLPRVATETVSCAAETGPLKRGRGRPPKQTKMSLTGTKRGRGRPPKQNLTPLVLQKLGRGRPSKQNAETISTAHNVKKCARPFEVVLTEFSTSQLCGKCCKKFGEKFGQDVRGRVLRFEVVEEGLAAADEVVKRHRGRPKKA